MIHCCQTVHCKKPIALYGLSSWLNFFLHCEIQLYNITCNKGLFITFYVCFYLQIKWFR